MREHGIEGEDIKKLLKKEKRVAFPVRKKPKRIGTGKRIFDLVFGSFIFVISLPLMIIIAILIKIDSKGPVFFLSKRVGTNFDVFTFYKFRTMEVNAENRKKQIQHRNIYYKVGGKTEIFEEKCPECERLGHPCSPVLVMDNKEVCESFYLKQKREQLLKTVFFKVADNEDPRVTRVGKILRRFHLDELPQLINVLKGDMSLVGNRPLPLEEAAKLTTDEWSYRFLAPSGMTGLWQVNQKRVLFAEERIALDNQYAFSAGFWFDMKILWKTFLKFFSREKSTSFEG